MVVGRAHDLIPQLACPHLAIDPEAIVALVGSGGLFFRGRLCAVYELRVAVGLHCPHEHIGHADRDVEVRELAGVLGMDKVLDVRMVAAQDAHLRAAARTGRFDCLARAVENAHIGDRAARPRMGAAHQGALRPDRREVVADAAAPTHGLGSRRQRGIDARLAVDDLGDRIADRLDEAVDERCREARPGGGIDAPGGNESILLSLQELRFPVCALVVGLDRGQRAGNATADVLDRAFAALRVFLDQHLGADLLFRRGVLLF